MAQLMRRPQTTTTVSGSIAANAYCRTTCTSPISASNQPKPHTASDSSASQ